MRRIFTNFHGLKKRCCKILLLTFCLVSVETFANRAAGQFAVKANVPPKIVTGKINDQNGLPLPGVSVKVKDMNIGAVTDANGNFTINVPEGSNVLVISFIGFATQEVSIANRSSVTINLAESASKLDEVIIVGYGSQSRETVTTSISKLDSEVLENLPFPSVLSALQGTVSGVRVQSISGQPGAPPRVIIRGGTSINSPNGAAPLYIVDGVIRLQMNGINSDDIESIQVLKDAAATAIYGARGSDGVVIVTTKSGKTGKTQISYNYDFTGSEVGPTYDLLTAREYIYYQRLGIVASARKTPSQMATLAQATGAGTGNDLTNNTAFTTQYLTPQNQYKLNEGWESMPDPVDPTKTIIFKETDFRDKLFRTGLSHNHNISASGGTEKASFNLGVGYLGSEGIAITTDYKRLSLNFNSNLKVRDNLDVFARLLYSRTTDKVIPNLSTIFRFSIAPAPTTKYRFEDGTLAPGQLATIGNPEYILSYNEVKNSLDNLTMAIGSKWNILPGLTFDPLLSIYQVSSDNRSFQKAYLNGPAQPVNTRTAIASYAKQLQFQADGVLTYLKSFNNKHNFESKLGLSYFGRNSNSIGATGNNAATDLIPTLNASGMAVNVAGSESEQVILGYFARLNYNYNQKYLLSMTARYDGSSNLGKNKWGFFPGISLGWNVHKERFWEALPENLLQLKLRGSYGVNGNIGSIGLYQPQGQYSVGEQYAGNAAIQNTELANPNLRWEQSKTLNFGADIDLFNNRVRILFDTYRRVTDNLLTTLALPRYTGFANTFTNLGSLENKGIELELSGSVLPAKSSFQWDVSFNVARVKNKILKLPFNNIQNNRVGGFFVWDPVRGDYAWLGGLQEGGRLGDQFAYKQVSIYSSDAEAAKGPKDTLVPGTNKTKYGGDVNWADLDANGIIDSRDRVYVGNIYPTWTGGFSNSFRYKSLDLIVRMDYTTGYTIYNEPQARLIGQFSGQMGLSRDVLRSWQKEGDITDVPKFYWADQQAQNNLNRGNSYYYQSGDFLAIREVTLGYTLPGKLLQRVKLTNMRFTLSGNNIHYFTKFTGINPEDGGTDTGRYPVPRNVIFGANITL